MFFLNYLIPVFILILFLFALKKPREVYGYFLRGCQEGLKSSLELFPYFLSMVFATTLLEKSNLIVDVFKLFNLTNQELVIQAIFRPISGNASFSMLINIYETYGIDSKEGIVSSILHCSSDTTLYIATVYTSICLVNNYKKSLFVGLFLNFLSFIMCMVVFYYLL